MKYFKKRPKNIIEIVIQHLWLNKHICINHDHIYYKNYENERIVYLNNTCEFLDYITLNENMI